MASSSVATTADTLINLKVNFDGTTRRFKLPLRDLGANVFEEKLRAFLHIPTDTATVVERYSDSATSYVVLHQANVAVYKQLYRAAKAKQKLKLRVTTKPTEPAKDMPAPKPVTIEDEPEEETKVAQDEPNKETQKEVENETVEPSLPEAPSGVVETVIAPQTNQDFPPFVKQWRARGNPRIHLRRNGDGVEVIDFLGSSATTKPLVTRESPEGSTPAATAQGKSPASLASIMRDLERKQQKILADLKKHDTERVEREEVAAAPKDLSTNRDFLKSSINNFDTWSTQQREALGALKKALACGNSQEYPIPTSTTGDDLSGITDPLRITEAEMAAFNEVATARQREARAKTVNELMAKSAMRLSKAETREPPKPATSATEEKDSKLVSQAVKIQQEFMKRPFTVCCNSCDRAVPEAHFHCSICDEGDFDLCQECVNRGISCHGDGHWLIRRTVVNGEIKCSSTHIAPKSARTPAPKPTTPKQISISAVSSTMSLPINSLGGPVPSDWHSDFNARTCNCCVQEFREDEFVHCTTCDDYDLCKGCFAKNQHGHHPKHGFTPAVKGSVLEHPVSSRLAPGRNVLHNAICDGCDKYVRGIRHKCLDCPDWDYCSDCAKDASFIHPNHRFVAIYEPLADRPFRTSSRATHYGISCDGPLCSSREGSSKYIVGERYKCAVCHDTDFCASCEASPANTHNKTHPLIKFKTPVRHVSVTTTGEHEDGQRLPTMGDRCHRSRTSTQSPEKPASPREKIAATSVQTVVDVQPTEQPIVPSPTHDDSVVIKEEASEAKPTVPVKSSERSPAKADLVAVFKWDTIQDGSILLPNHTFEQTWVLRNEGTVPWPAGCSVKFVGGDYMGAIDPAHPAGIHELVSASESTVCYNPLNPGQEFPFTVLMRTPDRDGKVISYWRLTTPDGVKFGHKLWCDVTVQAPSKPEQVKLQVPDVESEAKVEEEETTLAAISESRMIIPKLQHESPSASVLADRQLEAEVETESDTFAPSVDDDDFEDCGQDDWAEESDTGFMTDEEYDILDASDEEFLFEQQKMLSKK